MNLIYLGSSKILFISANKVLEGGKRVALQRGNMTNTTLAVIKVNINSDKLS